MTLLTGALLSLSWRELPTSVRPGLRLWLIAMLLHSVGAALLGLEGLVAPWASVVVANSLLALSLICFAMALRIFYQLPMRLGSHLVLWLAVLWVTVQGTYLTPNVQWRTVGLAFLLGALVAGCARAVFRAGGPRGIVPALTGSLFALTAIGMLGRAVHESVWPSLGSDLLFPTVANLACMGILVLLPTLATAGFLLMCTERSQQQLEHTARMDFLTDIYNRRAIEDLATRAISASRRHGIPMAIMIVDIDHFKDVNDRFGHEAGDRALVATVARMREQMRSEDLVGRLGGEEFVAVMPDIDLDSAHAAAERLRKAFVDRPMPLTGLGEGQPAVSLTISIGVAALEPNDAQFSHLLRRADRALYAAKAAGRNRVMLATEHAR